MRAGYVGLLETYEKASIRHKTIALENGSREFFCYFVVNELPICLIKED
jgi:hypothetical protein